MSQTHPSRWEALTEAARRCVAEKQFDKAEEAFLAALREAEQYGDGDPRVSATLNALARVYHRRSKFFPAAALLHRLLGIKEREHGEEHPELAGILNNLAEMYSRLGDARQELELRERALRIRTAAGETGGGAVEALHTRIAELQHKLEEERAREEAARNAPPPRIPVPTGATDLPLILPTQAAAPRFGSMPAMQAATRKAPALAPAPAPGATPVAAAPQVTPRTASPASTATMATPAASTTPAASAVATPAPEVERPVAPTARPRTPEPESDWRPIAPPAPDSTWKPLAPPAPDSSWKPIAPPAPDTSWKAVAPPAPETAWKPLAAPAPATSWPDADTDAETEPQPDDYLEAAPAQHRNYRPFALGGLAVAAIAAIAIFTLGGPDTADSSTGSIAAQPPSQTAPEPPPRAVQRPQNPAEAAALEAGLANLQQETEALPSDIGDPASRGFTSEPADGPQTAAPESRNSTDSAAERRLRVSLPTVAIDKLTSSIDQAARARVDSLTEANDKRVYEYTGKKPRQ